MPAWRLLAAVALVPTLTPSPVQADDDCNAVIEDMVAFLRPPPPLPNACTFGMPAIQAWVTTARVEPEALANAFGQPYQIDHGQVTVSGTQLSTSFLQLAMQGSGTEPVLPHELIGVGMDRSTATNSPMGTIGIPFVDASSVTLQISEGDAGAPARVRLSSLPHVVHTIHGSGRGSVEAIPVCRGSVMSGFFDNDTAFTIALIKTSVGGGLCSSP
jgi:hypothetical protein